MTLSLFPQDTELQNFELTPFQDWSGQKPVETEDISPVQETLLGCQPVSQEDGKESRVSVQERL